MCALQNHSACHERHRSSIDNVSSLNFVLKQASLKSKLKLTCKVEILFLTLFGCMFCPIFFRGEEAACQRKLQLPAPGLLRMLPGLE